MVEGHIVEDDGRRCTMTLRPGLRFHDGAPVLARDCVASITPLGRRDAFGQALIAATDELSAPDDRRIVFRLKNPFPLLPDALAKVAPTSAHHAGTPGRDRPLPAGPGDRSAAARSASWRPSASPAPATSMQRNRRTTCRAPRAAGDTAGGKVVHFDRVEWLTIPDAATAAAALQRGEVDWWEQPAIDLVRR